ncbi:MAG: hypothetical protein ACI4W7_00615, partial [Candidatus Spyradenecus sp.]
NMKATLAPTPAKMAREMLAADRRAQKRRHRARRARPVHTAPLIRPEMLADSCQPLAVSEARTARTKKAAKTQANRYPLAASSSLCDLLLAAIIWSTALVCVGLTLAIAAGIALRFFAS